MSRATGSHATNTSTFSYQSKPSLLAGVQDAYWSDDEEENSTCPLCIKELDLEEQSFKPCPCGYQICLFCWHHIRDNMNARCPACRREYTEEAVVWKPVAAEDSKRVQQQKKRKEKERKDLESLGRKSYLDVRIVQRNVVYVLGLGPRFAKEETITVLRSSDYFGRYGKISRIQLQKRTPPGADTPIVGLYITYVRREDAERAIAAIDGSPSPSGGGEVMRASFGTAKYCISFLRSVTCSNNNCLDAHEWGEQDDCFTREELATLKHTIKDTEKIRSTTTSKKSAPADAPPLPRAASWAARANQTVPSGQTIQLGPPGPVMRGSRPPRQPRNVSGSKPGGEKDKRRIIAPLPPTTAALVASPPPHLVSKTPGLSSVPVAIPDATSTEAVASTAASSPQLTASIAESESVVVSPALPNAQPFVPPGLTAPPGLAPPSVPSEAISPNPLPAPTPMHPPPGLVRLPPGLNYPSEQMSPVPVRPYQLSKTAKALIDDVRTRREAVTATPPPVFPDFDRTLATLLNSSGFSFSFANMALPETTLPSVRNTRKTTFDPFASPLEKQPGSGSASPATRSVSGDQRRGSFNPFGKEASFGEEMSDSSNAGRSRFDFARRQASLGAGARDNQSLSQVSRGSTPFKPDGVTGSTLYNSSDAGFVGRQSSWSSYQSNGTPSDYRHLGSINGVQFQTPLTLPLSETPNWAELAPTPFDQAPMSEHMRDLVRSFETPGIDGAGGYGVQSAGPTQYYQSGQYQGQAYPYQPQRTREDVNQAMMGQRSSTKSPADVEAMYSSYQQQPSSYHQQPSGAPGSMGAHQQQQQQQQQQGQNPPGISKEITSPNVSQAVPISVKHTPVLPVSTATAVRPIPLSERPASPTVQLIPSDNKEEFPALPSAPEPSTATRPAPQPPVITKPPPAPPMMRKVSAPAKTAPKVETSKKPTLPPLATTILSKGKDKETTDLTSATQSPAVEIVSARSDYKGKKDSTAASTPVTPAASASVAKGGKHMEMTKAPSKVKETKVASATSVSSPAPEPVVEHAPILARQTKKTKPQQLPKKKPVVTKEEPTPTKESTPELPSALPSAVEVPPQSSSQYAFSPSSIRNLLATLNDQRDLRTYRFFNGKSIRAHHPDNCRPISDAVHAISHALKVGMGDTTVADAAMTAFLQLHSALMDVVLELRNAMPIGTWGDHQAFEELVNGLKDTKASGYAAANENGGATKAIWMHDQLLKLEKLHSSINVASAKWMLDKGDQGQKYNDLIASRAEKSMDIKQLESELAVARKEVQASFEELREVMSSNVKLIAEFA